MKTISKYLKCIFASHTYLIFSIPLIALILYIAGLYFLSKSVWGFLTMPSSMVNDDALVGMSKLTFLSWSAGLVIFLPFLHMLFLPKVFYKTYDFILPISSLQKIISYVIISLLIFLYNFIIILILNYGVEYIFRIRYLENITAAFDRQGLLYTEIGKATIFNNGKYSFEFLKLSYLFYIIYPFGLFAALQFRKYSLIISTAIFIAIITIGIYIRGSIWEGYATPITNENYYVFYNVVPLLIATALCYIAFYYFLKEKEV